MTDAEIVALVAREIHQRFPLVLKYEAENLASVAVAALTEAGRLLPDGCVAIDAGRWNRVRRVASSARAMMRGEPDHMTLLLYPGDLDAEPTP